ncbi:MAG: hypothetical protein H6Q22_1009 [Bacteroidetes bacterium]|nr:hypothetical protein [Bacteroidota bacterium]
MGAKGTILSIIVLVFYLTSNLGIGRYSCHCNHASEISFIGISSECTCTQDVEKEDHNHHCPHCGKKLVEKIIKRTDCCSLKYFFLDADQDSFNNSHKFLAAHSPWFKPTESTDSFTQSVIPPRIKTFQALFHQAGLSLFIKYLQLIL